MKKRTSRQRQSGHRSGRSRTQNPKPPKRQTRGIQLLLIGILLAMGIWVLIRIPPGFLVAGSFVILVLLLLLLLLWFLHRFRLTSEERDWYTAQHQEAAQAEETSQMFGSRLVELQDLAQLTDKEFEYFTGALLETMGVLFEWERVGGGGDRGIDLRGKNQHNLPLVVQCKRFFGHKVTPDKTRDFGWALGLHGADEAWFVTTALFTKQARADVEKLTFRGHMKLVDGDLLVKYIHMYWHALPAEWQWKFTECMAARDRQRAERLAES